jgi:adenylate cyclase
VTATALRQRLVAILAADVAGYSRLMAADERATVTALDAARSVFRTQIESNQGRVIDMAGDSVLAVFETAAGAVSAALAVQQELNASSSAVPEDRRMRFRIGVHLGDVIEKADGTVYGDGVNIAARLQALAEIGGITISDAVQGAVRGKLSASFVDQGEQQVKNIPHPVRAFAVRAAGSAAAAPGKLSVPKLPVARRAAVVTAVLLVAAATGLNFAAPEFAKRVRTATAAFLVGKQAGIPDSRAAIAVLPFANQSGGETRDYFSDGITDDIINALGRFSGVMVIARNAVQEYKGRAARREEISRELGVRYIVQGSVRQADDKLRVAVELSDAEKGTLLWSERFEGEGKEVFEIQDRIVKNIVGALAVRLTRLEQQRVFAKPTENLEAYDLVLRARDLINHSERGANREARAMLEKALKLAPKYAEAYVALAEAELQRSGRGWMENPEDGVKRGEDLANQALALDEPGANARAHGLLSRVYSFTGQFDRALFEADRAIEQNVSDAFSYALRGQTLLWLGRLDESIAASEAARRFDPRIDPDSGFSLALAYYAAGHYKEALAAADTALARAPDYAYLHAVRAAAFAQTGNADEAHKAADQLRRRDPFFRVDLFGERFVDAKLKAKAQEGLRKAGL